MRVMQGILLSARTCTQTRKCTQIRKPPFGFSFFTKLQGSSTPSYCSGGV
jgi:hypothetical protein